jgi:glycosyltransferase involved in cell wall biosynthesis
VLTLHDAWLTTGHCSFSFDCDRWRTGCGKCPDLTIYPPILRDATRENWRTKRAIFQRCPRLYVATPSRWLMRRVEASLLAPSITEARVIPNSVDLSIFRPADRREARERLELPQDACILVFAAQLARRNDAKDFPVIRRALAPLGARPGPPVLCCVLGERAPEERFGRATVRFLPYEKDASTVARYYQAADLYVHAAKVDNFPNVVLEALACGAPVVATGVAGIPEQVRSLELPGVAGEWPLYPPSEATGILVPQGDDATLGAALELLLERHELRRLLSENAARDARERFDLERLVDAYVDWYYEILAREERGA